VRRVDAEYAGKTAGDLLATRGELWALEDHGGVDVHDPPAGVPQERQRMAQQLQRVGVPVALVGVREVLADIAEPGGPEQRIDDRVRENVGIGVPVEAALLRDRDAAEHQPPAVGEPVAVVADPAHRGHR
jgi:transposase InsO family protein